MKLTHPQSDPAKFNIDGDQFKNEIIHLDSTVKSSVFMDDEFDENGQLWLTIKWDIDIFKKGTTESIVTYSRNFRSLIMKCDTIDEDLVIINKLLYDTFINVEMDFQEQLPKLSHLKSTDMDVTSAQIIELLLDRGMY
ncbi:MAG: hypothetical protein KJ820_12765 [Bacteroidetes bacterium]|nr:hypothetical protein [Bacteroidota bacterium]MBU2268761.1 hypothetical protein [Bacteroidota bacterium]MBU2375681.1 hypothetical protein [Bacteroidota bacterium]